MVALTSYRLKYKKDTDFRSFLEQFEWICTLHVIISFNLGTPVPGLFTLLHIFLSLISTCGVKKKIIGGVIYCL
jgi:hypothetical protein